VINPGVLSTIQDLGRFKQAHLGITTGGPADEAAYLWANRLLNNAKNSAVLELSFGGLKLISNSSTTIAIAGADAPLSINGQAKDNWQSYRVQPDDEIEIGFASNGCRIYLAVAGGFIIDKQFGSVSTVIREKIGGINGASIKPEQQLKFAQTNKRTLYRLSNTHIPNYLKKIQIRVITGYQFPFFNRDQTINFFTNEYQVSSQSDRMGYRLTGPRIKSDISKLFSEGICKGAVQIPPDGQPIVLANDRQTIGGYPKIGSAFSLDLHKLMQCTQGSKVSFEPISIHCAHNLLHLAKAKYHNTQLIKVAL